MKMAKFNAGNMDRAIVANDNSNENDESDIIISSESYNQDDLGENVNYLYDLIQIVEVEHEDHLTVNFINLVKHMISLKKSLSKDEFMQIVNALDYQILSEIDRKLNMILKIKNDLIQKKDK